MEGFPLGVFAVLQFVTPFSQAEGQFTMICTLTLEVVLSGKHKLHGSFAC